MIESPTNPSSPMPPTAIQRNGAVGWVRLAVRKGMSLAELMIVIGIIAILGVLLLATVANIHKTANSVACLAHLSHIHAAFFNYANANNGSFPPRSDGNVKRSWEMMLSPYIGPIGAFQCPSDSEIFPREGSSYEWRDNYDSDTTLAGKNAGGAIRPGAVLAYETLPNWHTKSKMNAVRVDGTGESMDADACLNDLLKPVAISRPKSP